MRDKPYISDHIRHLSPSHPRKPFRLQGFYCDIELKIFGNRFTSDETKRRPYGGQRWLSDYLENSRDLWLCVRNGPVRFQSAFYRGASRCDFTSYRSEKLTGGMALGGYFPPLTVFRICRRHPRCDNRTGATDKRKPPSYQRLPVINPRMYDKIASHVCLSERGLSYMAKGDRLSRHFTVAPD